MGGLGGGWVDLICIRCSMRRHWGVIRAKKRRRHEALASRPLRRNLELVRAWGGGAHLHVPCHRWAIMKPKTVWKKKKPKHQSEASFLGMRPFRSPIDGVLKRIIDNPRWRARSHGQHDARSSKVTIDRFVCCFPARRSRHLKTTTTTTSA